MSKLELTNILDFWLEEFGESRISKGGTPYKSIKKTERIESFKSLFHTLVTEHGYTYETLTERFVKRTIVDFTTGPKAKGVGDWEAKNAAVGQDYSRALAQFFKDKGPKFSKGVSTIQEGVETSAAPMLVEPEEDKRYSKEIDRSKLNIPKPKKTLNKSYLDLIGAAEEEYEDKK